MEEDKLELDTNMEKDGFLTSSHSLSDSNHGNAVHHQRSVTGRITGPIRRPRKGGWTEEEDKILADAVRRYNGKSWKKIAERLPGRTDVQCLHRWQKVVNPDLVKGAWTREEDDLIIKMVEKLGHKKWSEIAKSLPGRIGKQCRERWHNHLNPGIKKTPWTKEEESFLIKAHDTYGNKWAEIAKIMHGRTENAIKNYWNSSVRRKLTYVSALNSNSQGSKTKAGSEEPGVVKQILDPKVDFVRSAETSLDLVLSTPSQRENSKRSSPQENSLLPKEWPSITTMPPSRTDGPLSTGEQHIETASNIAMARGLEQDMIDKHRSISCNTSGVPSGVLHDFFNISQRYESLDGPQGNTISGSDSRKLVAKPNEYVLIPFTDEAREKSRDNLEQSLLCYRPLQSEDLNIYFATGAFPHSGHYLAMEASTPTLSCKETSSNLSSPDSVLRCMARSFKNTPSILRRRRGKAPWNTNNHREDTSDEGEIESCNTSQRLRTSSTKSVKKCLQRVIDFEQDTTAFNSISRTS